jgi:cyclohexyl-isocyanide hydratase
MTPGLETLSSTQLTIGCFVFPRQDQIDFTGPFEVLSRIPNSTVHVIAKTKNPVRDVKGLMLTPEMSLADAPALDLLPAPGGLGQQALIEGEEILSLLRTKPMPGGISYQSAPVLYSAVLPAS